MSRNWGLHRHDFDVRLSSAAHRLGMQIALVFVIVAALALGWMAAQ